MNNDFLYVEKYRPKTVEECVLPDSIKRVFLTLRDKGEIINLLLSGGAGTGKTSIARALCNELDCDYIIINGSESRGIDMVRQQVTSFASTMSTNGKVKVVILDEADYITPEAQAALRNLIESFSSSCRFILTCNFKAKIIQPLHSRCSVIDFTIEKAELPKLQAEFAKRVLSILRSENIGFNTDVVLEIIKRYFPDNRRVLNELQRYANISGSIDTGILSVVDSSKIKNFISFIKKKDFKSCRQWVADNPDPDILFNELYDNISQLVEPQSIPELILIMGEYQHRAAFVASQEINLAAFVVETMKSVKWK
jgi:DNA polymerase III delta prime subunit